jgi:hypothetical protein
LRQGIGPRYDLPALIADKLLGLATRHARQSSDDRNTSAIKQSRSIFRRLDAHVMP